MQFALGVTGLIAPWCVAAAAVGSIPGIVALFNGRPRLGVVLIAATVLPLAWYLGSVFLDLLKFAERYPPGSRPPPWGGMGGFMAFMPLAWGGFMLVVGAVAVTAVALWSRFRRVP